jgi:hypothetical protein
MCFAISRAAGFKCSIYLGSRSAQDAYEFVADLASRLRTRVQLTSNGYRPYLEAVEAAG